MCKLQHLTGVLYQMAFKAVFSIINLIFALVTLFLTRRLKSFKNIFAPTIRRLLFTAAAVMGVHIIIANAFSTQCAGFAYCMYFLLLDWITFLLCRFSLEYTDQHAISHKLSRIFFILCIVDNIALIVSMFTGFMYSIYSHTESDGIHYYMTELKPPYYLHLALDYVLILIGMIYLFIALKKSYSFYRVKYISIIGVIVLIIILNILYMSMALPLDYSVMLYALAGCGIYYFSLLYVPRHIKVQSYGHVANHMSEGLVMFDKDRNCIFVNKMAEEELDINQETLKMDGNFLTSIIADRDIEEERNFSLLHKTADGRVFKVHFNNITDKKNRPLVAFFIFENITEENNAYQQAALARAEADKANLAKSAFLASMSHEIRTPINSVLGMNEMILRESDSPQISEYAQNIDSAGQTLLMLINDILDFSKIEAGKMELVCADYSFMEMVHDCYVMMLPKAEEKGLNFTVRINENTPCELYGDKSRISQIIINLISNAVKYTREGSVRLVLDYECISEDTLELIIRVADTGIGISEENQDKLFTAFTRVDQKKNQNIEGTGLGLAIVRQLTELMGGKVTVSSKPDRGSVFTVTLRQRIANPEACGKLDINKADTVKKDESSFTAPTAHILAVDDVPLNLKVVQALLKRTKLQVDTANGGNEAFKKCMECKYDLILMDHMMPSPDGVETFKRLRSTQGPNMDTPTIVLTANAINGVSSEYMEIGFDDYLSKPVKGSELEAMLLKHLPSDKVKQ